MEYIYAQSLTQITESGKPIAQWKGAKLENGEVVLPLTSGSYVFEVKE